VRLESPGGVLYRQERVGLNGQPFMLLKFRSMRADAEKDGVPKWAAINDQRVTRVGALIRKVRIDEIPQIVNVLMGDMSFIGPRPERPFFVDELRQVIPYYFERHRVKPGISGWAQLNYPYGASIEDAKEKFQFDLYYIKNYSLFLDLIVLIQTVRVVVWPHGVR
jgi:lipopolysaccharide/colanic/teichoic acid biosynthesis glycosyltransferase